MFTFFDFNLLYVLPILYVYFFPTILAAILKHHHLGGVFFVNLSVGWTIIGWFGVIVWAFNREAT